MICVVEKSLFEFCCALLAVEVVEGAVDVLRGVAFLVGQDQADQFWWHVVERWHDDFDVLCDVIFLQLEDRLG